MIGYSDSENRFPGLDATAHNWCTTRSGGRVVVSTNPAEVSGSQFTMEDIAAGLAGQCRFARQLRKDVEMYSVAQHSVLVSRLMRESMKHLFANSPDAPVFLAAIGLYALLHDADESFYGDQLYPIKKVVKESRGSCTAAGLAASFLFEVYYRAGFSVLGDGSIGWTPVYYQDRALRVHEEDEFGVCTVFLPLSLDLNRVLKRCDNVLLLVEMRDLMEPKQYEDWIVWKQRDCGSIDALPPIVPLLPSKAEGLFTHEYNTLRGILLSHSEKTSSNVTK